MSNNPSDVTDQANTVIEANGEIPVTLSGPSDFKAETEAPVPQIHVNTDGTITILPIDPQSLSGGSTDAEPVNDVIGDLDIEPSTPITLEMPEAPTIADVADTVN